MTDPAGVRRIRSVDQLELAADDFGPRHAPTVVLLHGGGQTRHSWAGAMKTLLQRGYRVINVDTRGHGESDWSPEGNYDLDTLVQDLRTVVAGVPRPYAIVGASLGGATAIHAAGGGIDAAAIVLVDIVPEPEMAGVGRIVSFMRANLGGFGTLEEAADAVAAYNPERKRSNDPAGLMRNLRRRNDGRLYWHWDPKITQTEPGRHHEVVQRSAIAMARRKDLPVLVVRGLKSDVVSDAGIAAFRNILPGLEVADVGGAGHMVAGDKNDAFNASVLEFLGRHLPIEAIA